MDRRDRIYTVSNALSLYRLCAAPAVAWAALSEQRTLFVVLIFISLASDAVDGILARRWHEETRLGARLDALADSLTLGAGLIGVWIFERTPFAEDPFWLFLFLGALALATLVSLLRFAKLPAFHLYSFKLADVVMTGFVALLFLYGFLPWLYILSMSLGAVAALEIIAVALVIDRFRTDLKGLWWVLRRGR